MAIKLSTRTGLIDLGQSIESQSFYQEQGRPVRALCDA